MSVAGVRAYPSILDVPDAVDLALVVVPAELVPASRRASAPRSGVYGIVIISAGFAEVGTSGKEAERAIVATARRNGMRVIGPNCLGIVNTAPEVRMNATFAPVEPVRGPVAFLSQSGGLGIELMSRAGELGIGISEFVSVGNKADVSGNDLLQHWETDPNTSVILFYLESFGNPRKFARLARRVARRKAIVAVKSGRTQAGSRAASSHTAALATPDVAVDALFRQAGVIRVDTLEQLLDTAQVLAHQPLPNGPARRDRRQRGRARDPRRRRVRGRRPRGSGALAMRRRRRCARSSRRDASVRQSGRPRRGGHAPSSTSARSRVVLADASGRRGARALRPAARHRRRRCRTRDRRRRRPATGDKPVVACFLGRAGVPGRAARRRRRDRTVPSFAFPEAAAHALGRAADLADWRAPPAGNGARVHRPRRGGRHRLVAERLRPAPADDHGPGCWLDATDAARLLDCFGVPLLVPHVVATRRRRGRGRRRVRATRSR